MTACFDDMLKRSIPQHDVMRSLVAELGGRFLQPASTVLDLGCSWGRALQGIAEQARAKYGPDRGDVDFVGYEVSPPMLEKAREVLADIDASVEAKDLRWWRAKNPGSCSVVLSVLTLQFVPINYRQQILREAHAALRRGGALILVEKVLGNGASLDDAFVGHYHEAKRAAGYSQAEIDAKASALEGVLVPITAPMNEALLAGAGFREVDCFWRALNFAGWIAVR